MLSYFSSPVPPRMSTMLVTIIICFDALQLVPNFAADAAPYLAQLRGPLQVNSFRVMVELKVICPPPSASSLPTKHAVASRTNHGVTTYSQAQMICKCVFEGTANLFGKVVLRVTVLAGCAQCSSPGPLPSSLSNYMIGRTIRQDPLSPALKSHDLLRIGSGRRITQE
jgi:hypothetical protein